MNRRQFLKGIAGAAAVTAIVPLVKFLPKAPVIHPENSELMQRLRELRKALEAGGYNAAPGSLMQGSALPIEDLEVTMNAVTFDTKHIKLWKAL